jgi:hemerythrin-like domain-containing protein
MSQAPRLLMVHDVEAAPGELLDDPLAFLFAEHWRHRQFCRALEEVAAMAAVPPGLLRRLAAFLGADMAVHVQDEEEDLFPLLRLRAEADDGLERVLGILGADHDAGLALARDLRTRLAEAAQEGIGPAAAPGLPESIGRFVAHKRRHIALENAVVLPIARLRLTPEDMAAMSRTMTERRAG